MSIIIFPKDWTWSRCMKWIAKQYGTFDIAHIDLLNGETNQTREQIFGDNWCYTIIPLTN